MFGRNTDHLAETLTRMHDEARLECKFNHAAMARKMAEWMAQDRRFDGIADKEKLAAEVFECRRSGRQLDLTPRLKSGATSTPGYVSRNIV